MGRITFILFFVEPDKNFALEKYGDDSRCFDHTNDMWEERSCRQVRQWQHWGSGCYEYNCTDGRLQIIVGDYTYTCYHAGQSVPVRILSGGWLRKGAIRCPPCRELCEPPSDAHLVDRFKCRASEESPPPNRYPRDELTCDTGGAPSPSINWLLIPLIITIVDFTTHWAL